MRGRSLFTSWFLGLNHLGLSELPGDRQLLERFLQELQKKFLAVREEHCVIHGPEGDSGGKQGRLEALQQDSFMIFYKINVLVLCANDRRTHMPLCIERLAATLWIWLLILELSGFIQIFT